jgi:hypothetical protein
MEVRTDELSSYFKFSTDPSTIKLCKECTAQRTRIIKLGNPPQNKVPHLSAQPECPMCRLMWAAISHFDLRLDNASHVWLFPREKRGEVSGGYVGVWARIMIVTYQFDKVKDVTNLIHDGEILRLGPGPRFDTVAERNERMESKESELVMIGFRGALNGREGALEGYSSPTYRVLLVSRSQRVSEAYERIGMIPWDTRASDFELATGRLAQWFEAVQPSEFTLV